MPSETTPACGDVPGNSGNGDAAGDRPPPVRSIVVGAAPPTRIDGTHHRRPTTGGGNATTAAVVVDTTLHRAVHKIRLSALARNYSEVESAANRQRCSVIVVVKADGYGHGAIPSAIYLADVLGADAFAVATLEEGIALRKALRETDAGTTGCGESLDRYFNVNQTLNPQGGGGGNYRDYHRQLSGSSRATADIDSVASLATNGALFDLYAVGGVGTKRTNLLRRAAHIRILVLGPPVGFPRCFDDYYHYDIEAMISGPEVATALYEWVSNTDERKRLQVERAANELKKKILLEPPSAPKAAAAAAFKANAREQANGNANETEGADNHSTASSSGRSSTKSSRSGVGQQQLQPQIPSATLTNVTGSDLAKEVREILKNQKLAAETQKQQQQQEHMEQLQLQQQQQQQLQQQQQGKANGHGGPAPIGGESASSSSSVDGGNAATTTTTTTGASALAAAFSAGSKKDAGGETLRLFAGLEETARNSRIRQKVMASEVFHDRGDDDDDDDDEEDSDLRTDRTTGDHSRQNHDRDDDGPGDGGDASAGVPTTKPSTTTNTPGRSSSRVTAGANPQAAIPTKKRLRWHALVDSGMGRLGFKTDPPVSKDDRGERQDTVEILKELVDLESTPDCPIDFHGMCTHMADASNATSTFTDSQMDRFKTLLERVRAAGISVPTISTDNSAALLTTNLTHFTANAKELLAQTDADSRGFVRTGGAIYGQRPSFSQLRAVSTLTASVRHVATLREGESVGYDRAYVATTSVRIATLTIGFADGYPRDLGNGVGRVSIRGHLFPVAGNVCMDMLMVELGPPASASVSSSDPSSDPSGGAGARIVVGDTAILWGPDDGEDGEGHVSLRDVAETLGTTQSALTCGLDRDRVLRRYA